MKSVHIAGFSVGMTAVALVGFATFLGTPARVLGTSYATALAARTITAAPSVADAFAAGSEHFWLTRAPEAELAKVSVAGTQIPVADIRNAVAVAGTLEAGHVDILDVQDISRISIGGAHSSDRAMLVTARLQAADGTPAKIVRVVLDIGPTTLVKAARAL